MSGDDAAVLAANDEHLQFIVTDARVIAGTDLAIVHAYENLLAGGGPQGTVAVINAFARRTDGSWGMVVHHGAPVMRV